MNTFEAVQEIAELFVDTQSAMNESDHGEQSLDEYLESIHSVDLELSGCPVTLHLDRACVLTGYTIERIKA